MSRKGLTLIELLVVIGIIAVLAGVVVIATPDYQELKVERTVIRSK